MTTQAAADEFADDPAPVLMFPINNVTRIWSSWGVTGTDRIRSTGAPTRALTGIESPDELPQDMEPY